MGITIIGLGPGGWGQITVEAREALEAAAEVYLRTRRHPTVASLPHHLKVRSFDHLYRQSSTFPQVYQAITQRVVAQGKRRQGVVYAVPGHPWVGEATTRQVVAQAREEGMEVRVIAGMSFIEPSLSLLELDPLTQGLQVVDAIDPQIDPSLPTLVAQIYSRTIASSLKVYLLELYPAEHPVRLVAAAGVVDREKVVEFPLYRLDRRPLPDPLICLYLPPLAPEENLASFSTLAYVMTRLRQGCPWDREQTHASLRANLVEESYEVLQALDEDDPSQLMEELGDLMMQAIFHAQIASEAGQFTIRDVLRAINSKLIRRHPHVFGQASATSVAEVWEHWEEIKREEKGGERSLLGEVPPGLPALAASHLIQTRAARAGFDWEGLRPVLEKVREELNELEEAASSQAREAELGDLLFALVNAARWLEVTSEDALRLANQRFCRRFVHMEEECRRRGVSFPQLSPEAQNALWEEAKRALG